MNHDAAPGRRTALKVALTNGSREAALVLVEHGASCNIGAILVREELEQLARWSTEALKEKNAQMERLVQGIPEWCAQAASAQASGQG